MEPSLNDKYTNYFKDDGYAKTADTVMWQSPVSLAQTHH